MSPGLVAAIVQLVGQHWEGVALDRLCRSVADVLPVDGVALTLSIPGSSRVVIAASDETARLLENMQLTAGVGPCTEAVTRGQQLAVSNLSVELDRWPGLAVPPSAGIGSVVASPLVSGSKVIGSMDCYRRDCHDFTPSELADVEEAGRVVVGVLALMQVPDSELGSGEDWEVLAPGQVALEQATGMVISALGLSAADALGRLRATAFVQDRSVTDVAHDVVNGDLSAGLNDVGDPSPSPQGGGKA